MFWRYRPKGNRTPLAHPVIGHLVYDGVYDHPDCATHPDFQETSEQDVVTDIVTDDPGPETPDTPVDAGDDTPDETDTPADAESVDEPAAKQKGAGRSGRSK